MAAVSIHPAVDNGIKPAAANFAGGTLTCKCADKKVTVSIASDAHNHVWLHEVLKPGCAVLAGRVVSRDKLSVTANSDKLNRDRRHHPASWCSGCGVRTGESNKNHPPMDSISSTRSSRRSWVVAAGIRGVRLVDHRAGAIQQHGRGPGEAQADRPQPQIAFAAADVIATHTAKAKGVRPSAGPCSRRLLTRAAATTRGASNLPRRAPLKRQQSRRGGCAFRRGSEHADRSDLADIAHVRSPTGWRSIPGIFTRRTVRYRAEAVRSSSSRARAGRPVRRRCPDGFISLRDGARFAPRFSPRRAGSCRCRTRRAFSGEILPPVTGATTTQDYVQRRASASAHGVGASDASVSLPGPHPGGGDVQHVVDSVPFAYRRLRCARRSPAAAHPCRLPARLR